MKRIAICLLLLLALPLHAQEYDYVAGAGGAAATPTITYVTGTEKHDFNPGTTLTTATGIDVAAGDLIIVGVLYGVAGTLAVADDATTPNTATMGAVVGTGDYQTQLGYIVVTTAKTGAKFTATFQNAQASKNTSIEVLKFTKSSGTWAYINTAASAFAYTTTRTTTTYNTTGAAGVSVAFGINIGGNGPMTTHTIGGTNATLAPEVYSVFLQGYYLTHGAITGLAANSVITSNTTFGVSVLTMEAQ